MLVLSRKKGEQIQIGDSITITVLKVKGTSVQIGIDAPTHVKILRGELSFEPPAALPDCELRQSTITRRSDLGMPRPYEHEDVTLADTLVFYG